MYEEKAGNGTLIKEDKNRFSRISFQAKRMDYSDSKEFIKSTRQLNKAEKHYHQNTKAPKVV